MRKRERQKVILELVRAERIPNQARLRDRLRRVGITVAQATLSRDVRELGLVKRASADGRASYQAAGEERERTPEIQRLLPGLFVRAEGTGNLLLLRTRVGGAQSVAAAIDGEAWPEVLGTLAGDDTILVILRRTRDLPTVQERIEGLARG